MHHQGHKNRKFINIRINPEGGVHIGEGRIKAFRKELPEQQPVGRQVDRAGEAHNHQRPGIFQDHFQLSPYPCRPETDKLFPKHQQREQAGHIIGIDDKIRTFLNTVKCRYKRLVVR
ncbi:hypothetical protein D9M68_822330 [compost metagenome]